MGGMEIHFSQPEPDGRPHIWDCISHATLNTPSGSDFDSPSFHKGGPEYNCSSYPLRIGQGGHSLPLVCRQLHAESHTLLYSLNIISFECHDEAAEFSNKRLTKPQRDAVTDIVHRSHYHWLYLKKVKPYTVLFPNLKRLQLYLPYQTLYTPYQSQVARFYESEEQLVQFWKKLEGEEVDIVVRGRENVEWGS
jgi:hypothetical protein